MNTQAPETTKCLRCGSVFTSPQIGTAAISMITKALKTPTIDELEKILEQESESHTLPSGEVLAKKDVLIDRTTTACGTCISGLRDRIEATFNAWLADRPMPESLPPERQKRSHSPRKPRT